MPRHTKSPALLPGARLPTLLSERVTLRWIEERDVTDLFAIFSSAEVMRYTSRKPFTAIAQARELLQEIHDYFREQTLFQWGVALREDDRVIGTCTLFALERESRRAEIGYLLGRAHWGVGYMAEALRTLAAFAFGELDLRRLEADIDPRNAASVRAVERLGFVREGLLRERWEVNGELQDTVLYGLLKRDYQP